MYLYTHTYRRPTTTTQKVAHCVFCTFHFCWTCSKKKEQRWRFSTHVLMWTSAESVDKRSSTSQRANQLIDPEDGLILEVNRLGKPTLASEAGEQVLYYAWIQLFRIGQRLLRPSNLCDHDVVSNAGMCGGETERHTTQITRARVTNPSEAAWRRSLCLCLQGNVSLLAPLRSWQLCVASRAG